METFATTQERCKSQVGDTMRITRAAIYARYSSEEQTGGESVEYQLERCREYIAKQGWLLEEANVFVDRARSGTTTYRREAFNQMVAVAKDRPFDVVVTWSTSRFGRDQDEAIFHKISLRRQGVEVKFVSQPVPDGHIGTLIERIYEWKDEFDSIQIGEYAFQGQKQVTQKGFHGGGKAPYGYRRVKVPDPDAKTDKDGNVVEYVTYEVVEAQAAVVRRVFEMYAEGASYRGIAHALNPEGITSPGGSTWDLSAVRTILLNESYLGRRVWNQTRRNKKVRRGTKIPKPREEWVITENAHEAIVSVDLWERVAARRGQIRLQMDGKGGSRTARSTHMFTGVLKCDECGANYVASSRSSKGKRYFYYRCSYHANRGKSVCTNSRMVSKRRIEGGGLQALALGLFTVETIESVLDEYRTQAATFDAGDKGRAKDFDGQIRQADREIQNLTVAIKEGGPISELVVELKTVKERKASIEAERASAEFLKPVDLGEISVEEVKAAVLNLQETLEEATPQERKDLIRENVKEIRIPKEGDAVLVADPDGLARALGVHSFGDPEGSRTPVS